MLNAGDFLQNRYEIINCIGSGGMADVYKAKDHKLNRFVAVKVLKPEYRGDREFVSKFRVEAQAAAGLAHPNIVNVYDVGDENGIYFIVMELVEGITLKAYIQNKRKLSVRETIGISLQVAAGLEAAHNNGIIHRDVKPQNIIISTDGTAKVADFGIARAVSSDTINSNVMGSVHYSAPEQSRGGFSDAKSDIYSLGITMYEMLTGRVPFDGDSTVEVALKHLQEEILSPRQFVPDLPRAIESIIMKCTQKSPDRRYQSMSLLIRDLKESLVNPNGDYVKIGPENAAGATHRYSREDVDEIKRRSREGDGSYPGLFDGSYDGRMNYPPEDDAFTGDELLDYGSEDYDPDTLGENPPARSARMREKDRRAGAGAGEQRTRTERIVTLLSVLAAFAVIGVILFLAIHTFGLFSKGTGQNSTENETSISLNFTADVVSVPDVRGKTELEAQKLLKDSGLGYHFLGEVSSEDYPSGQVVSQDQKPGVKVKKNTTVGYQLSIGSAQTLTVPDLEKKAQKDAESALTSMGLKVSVDTTRYSNDIDEGCVITTNPGAGSSVRQGDTVTIFVSQGQDSQSVTVPDTVGKYKDDAVTMLTNYGLYVYVTTEPSDKVAEGLVIRQEFEPGSSVQTGSSITITVSSGPEDAIVINPDANTDAGSNTGTSQGTSGKWMCNAQLQAPDGYTDGSSVRIVLEQNGGQTVEFEGQANFPYILNVEGAPGQTEGTVYVYVLDSSGNTVSTTTYSPINFQEAG